MSNDQQYQPTRRFQNTNTLFSNHFKFTIEALPDLTQFVTAFALPSLSVEAVERPTPFANVSETGDHLRFNAFTVKFRVDALFQTYFSLFWWMRGVAFPQSFEQIAEFTAARQAALQNPRPAFFEIMKTTATLAVLAPDSDSIISEIHFTDVHPSGTGELAFQTGDQEELTCMATFNYTDFSVQLTNP